jgi:hypothetical protein
MTDGSGSEQAGRADHLESYRWKPGQSGNPAGRPRGIPDLASAINRMLEGDDADGRPRMDVIAEKLLELFMDGHPVAIREVTRRLWPEKLAEVFALQINATVAPTDEEIHVHTAEKVQQAVDVVFEVLGLAKGES